MISGLKKIRQAFHLLRGRHIEFDLKPYHTEDGIDMAVEGLTRPTSTWTYLINDNPFGDFMKGLREGFGCLKGLKRALTDKSP